MTLPFMSLWPLQALPIFLDRIFHPVVAVILSVTFVLAFGEVFIWRPKIAICSSDSLIDRVVLLHQVIPQAICTRYGLAVGANFVWLVRILMVLCYPIAYPIGKVSQQNHMIKFCVPTTVLQFYVLLSWHIFWIPWITLW